MRRLQLLVEIWCHTTTPRLYLCISETPSSDEARGLFDTALIYMILTLFVLMIFAQTLSAMLSFREMSRHVMVASSTCLGSRSGDFNMVLQFKGEQFVSCFAVVLICLSCDRHGWLICSPIRHQQNVLGARHLALF